MNAPIDQVSGDRLAVDLDANVSSMLALLGERLGLPAEEVVAAGLRLLVASLARGSIVNPRT